MENCKQTINVASILRIDSLYKPKVGDVVIRNSSASGTSFKIVTEVRDNGFSYITITETGEEKMFLTSNEDLSTFEGNPVVSYHYLHNLKDIYSPIKIVGGRT